MSIQTDLVHLYKSCGVFRGILLSWSWGIGSVAKSVVAVNQCFLYSHS